MTLSTSTLRCWILLPSFLLIATAIPFQAAEPVASQPVNLLTRQTPEGEIEGWKCYSEKPDTKPKEVWKLGSDGILVCKGTPRGYLYTEKDYTSFVLKLEWRWPPKGKAGNGGALLRLTGPNKIWPKSLEAQINAGVAGDFWGLAGFDLTGPADRLKVINHAQFGKLTNLLKTAPVEKPTGEWNQYEIVVEGDSVTLTINGTQVNHATGCDRHPGKIALTAEGDEIHFRNVHLLPKE